MLANLLEKGGFMDQLSLDVLKSPDFRVNDIFSFALPGGGVEGALRIFRTVQETCLDREYIHYGVKPDKPVSVQRIR